jgi:hypothetical protein
MFENSDYGRACKEASDRQGVTAIADALRARGIVSNIVQTGGFCMVGYVGDFDGEHICYNAESAGYMPAETPENEGADGETFMRFDTGDFDEENGGLLPEPLAQMVQAIADAWEMCASNTETVIKVGTVDARSRSLLVQFGLEDGPEFFAPWAVTRENVSEAIANAQTTIEQWQTDSATEEGWAENTDQVMTYVSDLLGAIGEVL